MKVHDNLYKEINRIRGIVPTMPVAFNNDQGYDQFSQAKALQVDA